MAVILSSCAGSGSASTTTAPTPTTVATSSPTTTVAPTSTVTVSPPDSLDIEAICAILTNQPYEARKAAIADVADRTALAAACGAELTVLEEALAVEQATSSIEAMDFTYLDDGLTCSTSGFEWTATNTFDVAVGVYISASLSRPVGDDGDVETVGSPEPQVAWRIEPGGTVVLAGSFLEHEGEYPNCSIKGHLVLADDPNLPGDASTPGVEIPDGLDATLWIGELFAREDAYQQSFNPHLVAPFEDLRSVAYRGLVEKSSTEKPWILVDGTKDVNTCWIFSSPDDAHVALIYERSTTDRTYEREGETSESEASERLAVGVFRRAQDGGWRWLGTGLTLDLGDITDCAGLSETQAT